MRTGLLLAPVALLAACQQPQSITVENAWVRLAAVPTNPSAAYFTVRASGKDETLTSVTTGAAMRSEMHESMTSGGVMSMKPVKLVAVRAGSAVAFAPGGKHVMLFGLSDVVKPGATVPMTFTFASGRTIVATAKVVGAGDDEPK